MAHTRLSRRTMLTGTTALATLAAASREALAQQTVSRSAAAPGAPLPPRREFVIRGAKVLSMDPNTGDFAAGDVHVRDGAIVAVAPRIDQTNVQIIEAGNMICMPGFVDSHWHLWTSLLRPFIRADVDELGYFSVSFRLGQLFTPEDSYRSVLLGLAEALSAGVTTVHNWAHNVRSPDHADAELSAMRDAGIRGRFAYGPAQGMRDDQPMGVKVSLSTDHTTNYNCDPFVAMRILFALHQHRIGNEIPVTVKRLVQLATLDGAVDLGIAEKTGSLTPGKRADIILVRTSDINMAPVGDPYEALVSLAQPSNVDTVIVDGRILRQSGKFTALDHGKVVQEAKGAAAALRTQASWPT
jgi:cytosine/adenosine deaminase-related metal-dependent hydrolase